MKQQSITQRVGAAFRQRREALKTSQEAFADKIDMHRTYYSAIERGEKNLTLETIERVCIGLNTTIWEIFKTAETHKSAD